MAIDEKINEIRTLLKRAFSRIDLFEIGRELKAPYFDKFSSGWDTDEDEASLEIASRINDEKLREIFSTYQPRKWVSFRGRYYTLEDGALSLKGSWDILREGVSLSKSRHGKDCIAILKAMTNAGRRLSVEDIRRNLEGIDVHSILSELERAKVIVPHYKGEEYQEWEIPEEIAPLVELELGIKRTQAPYLKRKAVTTMPITPTTEAGKVDPVLEERGRIESMESELADYLEDLLKHRLEGVTRFGERFNISALSSYLQELFGSVLYFDSLLSITQQYGLANVEIIHEYGKTGSRTGWSLALFGEPGTGKSFSTRDMILGKPSAKIPPHGIPNRNRYCGGMTPARFLRIGQAYAGRTFNFIVPEFNDFFKYKGMVEPLKLAMEQGEIKYETHREVIGPYRFACFFSVNYNVSVYGRGYEVTVQDPNFNAIEDRMLCRLHRLTKERYIEIAKSQMRLALGEIDIEKGAQNIRDHLALVYAIETDHPIVKGRFPYKPVMITPQFYETIGKAREAILEEIPDKTVKFSARLEDRAVRFACAASLMEYFHSDLDYIPIGEEAIKYAVQLYVEEASVRSLETFMPEEVLKKIYKD